MSQENAATKNRGMGTTNADDSRTSLTHKVTAAGAASREAAAAAIDFPCSCPDCFPWG